MKLVSFSHNGYPGFGIFRQDKIYRATDIHPMLPVTMQQFLDDIELYTNVFHKNLHRTGIIEPVVNAELIAPVPYPASFRDGYAFRQHVASARKNRGLDMVPEFDHYPVFYFGNTANIFGPGSASFMPDHFERLDFELEVAAVIGKGGMNISAENAHEHIAGLMLLNDWSARTLQMEEMLLNLGPAKGKDLGCSIGPWLVTLDELADQEIPAPHHHRGKSWDVDIHAYVNSELLSQGNLVDMHWTFGELIERASYGVTLRPGDIIGSGTVGTGCLLELNGTHKTNRWLQENDVVTFTSNVLGVLTNTVNRIPSDHSLLKLKSNYVAGL